MIRTFDVQPAYDEWDALYKPSGIKHTLEGERAYQLLLATGKPADDMPARVKRR